MNEDALTLIQKLKSDVMKLAEMHNGTPEEGLKSSLQWASFQTTNDYVPPERLAKMITTFYSSDKDEIERIIKTLQEETL